MDKPYYLVASDGQYQSLAGYDEFTIGRAIDNHLVLEDSAVSRKHAALIPQAAGYLVRDLNSSNGTLVNAISIKEVLAKNGDIIQIGRFVFELREGEEAEIVEQLKKRVEKVREDHPTAVLGKLHLLREEKIAGELEHFNMVPLVQTLIAEKKTGILRVDYRNQFVGALYFMEGAIIDAECQPAPDGRLAAFELLKHKKGRFAFDASMVPRPPMIEEDSTSLLLEGCRRLDENEMKKDD